ncbi:VOC family protein [Nocardioides sp. J2M5]|uniref:VOC family protein n=1 Tax=Nocardioides palaemonis TaxID=2829810 RepID=UPI001BAAA531|nr:VOC family protein [Nocardioides palaemonis]MBS2939850.1 VOC family protein [Nocardioides palaemonis]
MATPLLALVVRTSDPDAVARFWGDLLGRDGDRAPVALRFVATDERRQGLNPLHLHLTSNDRTQRETVERALALGATHRDVGQLPDEPHVVLADPGGDEFCVIPEGNNWLAGTGFLGELAADGTRDLGVFWSRALGWPLVHDEDGETAVSAPGGGFKIAWGGEPLNPKHRPDRMYLELAVDDLATDVDRLVSLGASVVARHGDEVELADPDGNEVRVRAK